MGLVAETLRDIARAPAAARKSLSFPHDGRYTLPWRAGLPNERNLEEFVGDGANNSIVGAAVNWISRNAPAAPLTLVRELEAGVPETIRQHEFIRSWRRPTWIPEERRSWYSGRALWMAIYASFTIDGNAYVGKVRDQTGDVVQRWYIPHWLIEPKWPEERGNQVFISHYEYRPFGVPVKVDPADVDHFRFGIDSANTRKGWSPLKTVLREILTDEEAARFTASVLINFGMPGVLISPAAIAGAVGKGMNENERLALKEHFIQTFSGDRRGEPMVLSRPAELKQFGFSPKDLELSSLRDVPEERVSAVLGLPAAVLQLGTGLQGVKVGATMRMNWDMAWKGNVIPTQEILAEDLWAQSLPEFVDDDELDALMPFFDYRRAGVLHDDRMAEATYWSTLARAAIAQRREARAGLGLPVTDLDKVYIPQPGVELVDPQQQPALEAGDEEEEEETEEPVEGEVVEEEEQAALPSGLRRLARRSGKNGHTRKAARKPVGPFATFEECVDRMLEDGYDEESARNICGSMEEDSAKQTAKALAQLAEAHRIGAEVSARATLELAKAIASAPQPVTNITIPAREPGAWAVKKDAKGRPTALEPVRETSKPG